jgi:hypothetical protein
MVDRPHDITDYGVEQTLCEGINCDAVAEVVTPAGYLCRDCADDLVHGESQ